MNVGTLAGTDTRWDVISQSVDDRTAAERGQKEGQGEGKGEGEGEDKELVAGGKKRLYKSRYSSVSRFIGKTESIEERAALESLNDMDANMDEEAYKMLTEGGLDHSLASHIAHLFVRDPLVIFDDAVVLDDKTAMVRTKQKRSEEERREMEMFTYHMISILLFCDININCN